MANKVTIDVEARFIDNVTDEAKSAAKSFNDLEKAAEGAQKDVNALGKTKVKPKVDADSDRAAKKLDAIDKKLNKIGKTRSESKLSVLDKASATIDKVTAKVKAFAGKTYSGLVKIRDSNVLSTLSKMSSGLKSLTGKVWSIAVKVPSTIFGTLNNLKNSLFNIKNLIAGIATAWAASKVFGGAISVADAYSSAKISFSTLLGDAAGQKMMDDLDAFAKATPFGTTNVIDNANKMLAMGWNAENIIRDMEIIGNAAAATGKMDQGLESIVRALSQIKTKGKLSTEELNQLAEAGIAAKAMLAEQLGYGTGDAGIAKMTKDLEDGAIASDVALEALLAGMQKYDGMMESMANETAKGLWSQLQDVFEINIVRKWGQGLQDGAKRGLGTILELLDDAEDALAAFGDTVYEAGKKLSNWAADKLEKAIKKLTKITGSSEFKNASLKVKLSMLWEGLVADPLQEWWDNGGKDKTVETAGTIGGAMGRMLQNGLLTIFGATDFLDSDATDMSAAAEIAKSFSDAFAENFDASVVTDKLVEAIGNVWDAIPTWAKVLLGVWGAGTAAGGIATAAGAVTSAIGTATATLGTAGVAGLGASGILGGAANAGYTLMGGTSALSVTGGTAALAGAAGIAGGAAGVASAGKGVIDLYKGYTTDDAVEAGARKRSGWTALGGVGAGAGIGFALGGPLGALIGAGVGGIGGWIGGNKWADKYRDINTTVGVNITGEKNIMNTIEVLAEDFGIPEEHADTVALLLAGDKEILSKIDTAKLAEELGVPESVAQEVITKLSGAKSIEERVEVLSTELVDATEVWQTITVNLKSKVGQVIDKVSGFVSSVFGSDRSVEKDSGYRGGIFGGDSAMDAFARGGIVGGSTRFIRVNEEAPEMIIPLSNQRRDRAMKLWMKTGEMLDVPGFARGGITSGGSQDEGIRFRGYGSSETEVGHTVQVNMGGITLEINVSSSDTEGIADAIRAQANEIAEAVAGIMADAIGSQYENTPVRGGAA